MTSHQPPPIGAFLRPVGKSFAYCVRVLQVYPAEPGDDECVEYERWGMDGNRQPVDDGHHGKGWVRNLVQVLPGVWKDFSTFNGFTRWDCCPLYYRLIDHDQDGQKALF